MPIQRKDLWTIAGIVVVANLLAVGAAIWSARTGDAPPVQSLDGEATLDSIWNRLRADTIQFVVPDSEMSPQGQEIVDALQRQHAQILQRIEASTEQRNEDMATLERLSRLATCNTSGLVPGGAPNRYSYCRGLRVSMLGGLVAPGVQ